MVDNQIAIDTVERVTAHTYQLMNGERIDLSALPGEDLAFLAHLQGRALGGESGFTISDAVCSSYAYPLKGSRFVTEEISQTPLFRVARDISFRVLVQQGVMVPNPGEPVPIEDVMSVTEAAEQLGITRAAVIKAVHAHRIVGRKVGKTWALVKASVDRYRVAAHRVAAGKARSPS